MRGGTERGAGRGVEVKELRMSAFFSSKNAAKSSAVIEDCGGGAGMLRRENRNNCCGLDNDLFILVSFLVRENPILKMRAKTICKDLPCFSLAVRNPPPCYVVVYGASKFHMLFIL